MKDEWRLKCVSGLTLTLLLGAGCSSNPTQPTKQPETLSKSEIKNLSLQTATVTEVFHLRGECSALGDKLEEKKSRYLKDKEYVILKRTNYSLAANRCYVLIVMQHELTKSTALYDGQTEDSLALTLQYTDGSPSRGFIGNGLDGRGKETEYSKATDYMNRLMDDGSRSNEQ